MLNNATVPVALGKVIVLSEPEASAAVSIISLPSAVDPSNVIFPLASVIELAPSTVPETNVVDCKELKPVNTVAPPPRATVVPPIRNVLLAKLLFCIEDPVVNTVPELSGNVIVLSAVGSVRAKVVSKLFAVEPSNTILPFSSFIALAASAVPAINVVEAKEFTPVIVETVPPKETLVLPMVTAELANCPLGIALVPNSPVELLYVSPDPEAILSKPLISELEGPV